VSWGDLKDPTLAEGTRVIHGDPLLVWGEYDEDALRIRSAPDLAIALDALHGLSTREPCLVRLWSTSDDQAVAVLSGPDAAVYLVGGQGYGRSIGDAHRTDVVEVSDHDVGPIQISCADCISWQVARAALLNFADSGDLGDRVRLDGSIPTQLIMFGDYDRAAELETRRDPPADPALSSLPRRAPQGEWARRLVRTLRELQLIELDEHIVESIVARVTILLLQSGDDAIDSPDVAGKLARELERVRGIGALFATGGDLQIALRRTQDPPTNPVDVAIG